MNIQIITVKSWNVHNAMHFRDMHPEHSIHISEILDIDAITSFNPDYIIFPHWSDKIPSKIYEKYKCVVFHLTDLPFGRGGSPLQNLIVNKIYNTKITAIAVTEQLDAGGIYCQRAINISDGSAEEILRKVSDIIFSVMLPIIINNNSTPKKQEGQPSYFKRRTLEQSNMSKTSFNDVYDFIRMLDGEGYPPAFLNTENLRIVFRNTQKEKDKIIGNFEIYDNK